MAHLMGDYLNRTPLRSRNSIEFFNKPDINNKNFAAICDGGESIIFICREVDVNGNVERQNFLHTIHNLTHPRPIVAISFAGDIFGAAPSPAISYRELAKGRCRGGISPAKMVSTCYCKQS